MSSPASLAPTIPTVDLSDLCSTDHVRLKRAAVAVEVAFRSYGLVYVSGHDITPALLDRFYGAYQDFSNLPEAQKRALARPDIYFQRGWTPPNTEQAVAAQGQPDFKECYFASATPLKAEDRVKYPAIYADNIWPDGHPEFQRGLLDVGRRLQAAGELLLEGCAIALHLDRDAFTKRSKFGPHVTRALRYLPLKAEQVGTPILWGEEHTDFNLLTLLPGGRFVNPQGAMCDRPDEQSGLFLRTRPSAEHPNGERIAGTAPAGCIVAQVGQQLEILTGGRFQATPHEITTPKTPDYSRLSLAHFIHTHTDEVLAPLAPLATAEAIAAYSPPVLAGTYDLKTLVDIGLAPASELNRLGYRHYDRLSTAHAKERV